MRWLCDEMLGRLARLLRAAGEDAAVAEPQATDAALIARAGREERRLLTRDRSLAARAGERGLLLAADRPMAQAEELAAAVPVDWRGRRFSRCLVDNTPLRPASAAEIAAMPADSQAMAGPFRACPACGRVYWPGSHARRLGERLDRLASISAARR